MLREQGAGLASRKTHADTRERFDSLKANLYLAAKPSDLKEGKEGGGQGGMEGRKPGAVSTAWVPSAGDHSPAQWWWCWCLCCCCCWSSMSWRRSWVAMVTRVTSNIISQKLICASLLISRSFMISSMVALFFTCCKGRDRMRAKPGHPQLKLPPRLSGTLTAARSPTAWPCAWVRPLAIITHCFGYSNDSPTVMKQSGSHRLAPLAGHRATCRLMNAAVFCSHKPLL